MPTSERTDRPPLRALREAQRLSLREVARRAEVDPAHLGRVERGEARFSVDALARVAKVLGLRDLSRDLARYAKGGGP
jgi:transcriptional regulator with XRE-family HTH domain